MDFKNPREKLIYEAKLGLYNAKADLSVLANLELTATDKKQGAQLKSDQVKTEATINILEIRLRALEIMKDL